MMMLMRYPAVSDVTPIVDLADMIRRGVLDTGAHIGPASRNRTPSYSPETPQTTLATASPAPKWLLGLGSTSQTNASWQGVGRR